MQQTVPNVEEIFFAALELEGPAARSAFLDRACGTTELRRQVERLLAHDAQASDFLEAPALSPTITTVHEPRPGVEGPGTVVGPYRLMEAIGEGGMGVVYVAEQHEPVRRKVALKVIKPGMDSRQVIARFEAERQALAMMDHPNIAKVLDAGATPSGRPFFVMELVRGLPVTEYCDRHELSIPERLELFVLVCRAVQHAHQKGVIHRDLKPSNILVADMDGVAVPKVIDFGVAKATGPALTDKTVYTGFHQFVGTPLYTSPEQAELSGVDVDTRSDIYSLGVLLYELLTGTTPFDSEALKKAAFDEMRRIIREEEPPRPSTRLSTLGARLSTVSSRRKADPKRLGPSIKGELDWVVMKALEKDRRRRYETAGDFAADVMNYLADRPVGAVPPSAWYRLGKAASRNRAALAVAALVTLVLVLGTAVSVWQAARASEAEAEALRRAEESAQVVDFLVDDVFGTIAPEKARGRSPSVLDLLKEADENLTERFADRPLIEASVRMALARAYGFGWDAENQAGNAARAAELRERFLGPDHLETLDALQLQAQGLIARVDPDKAEAAEPLARRAYLGRRRQLGPRHPDTLTSQTYLATGLAYSGRADQGLPLLAEAEALATRHLGPADPLTLEIRHWFGVVLFRSGEPKRGEAVLRQDAENYEQVLGALHPRTISCLNDLARSRVVCGRLAEARAPFVEALRRGVAAYGPDHIQISSTLGRLSVVLVWLEDFAAIRELHEDLLRELLATPLEPGPYMRERRVVQLLGCLRWLAGLPDGIPFDADLALRAAAEVDELGEGKAGGVTLALLHCRTGRVDLAAQTLEAAKARPNWAELEDDYAWLVEALIRARRGELAEARRLYDRARGRAEPSAFGRVNWQGLQRSVEASLGIEPAPGGGLAASELPPDRRYRTPGAGLPEGW